MLFWIACAVVAVLMGYFLYKNKGDAFFGTLFIGGFLLAFVFALIIPLISADASTPALRRQIEIDPGSVHQVFDVNSEEEIYNFTIKGKPMSVSVAKKDSDAKNDHDGDTLTTMLTTDVNRLSYYCHDSSPWSVPWTMTDGCFYTLKVSQG